MIYFRLIINFVSAITSIEIFNALKQKLGEREAQMLTQYIEESVSENLDRAKEHIATKEDLIKETGALRVEMKEQKSEIIKWMFIFWVSQVAATFALLKFLE